MSKQDASKKCNELYDELKKNDFIKNENKFSHSADKLDEVIVL
jgi:hypothetical protein